MPSLRGLLTAVAIVLMLVLLAFGLVEGVVGPDNNARIPPQLVLGVAIAFLVGVLAFAWRRRRQRPAGADAAARPSLLRSLAVIVLLVLACVGLLLVLAWLGILD